ncbi:ferric enterobactin receptor [Marivirga lumbricoides]|uniref:Ferric enterobactin receptor n=1 Tax=Marivirga lumbricoides TaxID=1046115 RepID=A0A2T4DT42_9BACT|nr:ferric enterobactin receptor [Marivirga lumbricoides]
MKSPKFIILFYLFIVSQNLFSQTKIINGIVKDAADQSPIPGVNVVIKGTTQGASTDADGKFSLQAPSDAKILIVSFIGYTTKEVAIPPSGNITVELYQGISQMDEVVVSVGRGVQRTTTDTPVPVDILKATELQETGQFTFDKALQYKVPSFNTVQTPVNDATSLLDPYEIRNMGPSRTLILINGKRKNLSSLLYTQTSPGRGETGADISAIPTDAIKRVEILRDGASAQYGSDAIAGVMNIILKDASDAGSFNVRTGITSEGDGEMIGISLNNGSSIFKEGFINYTVGFKKVELANRPGRVDALGEATDFLNGTAEDVARVNQFLALKPDAGNINGSPETATANFLVNSGINISENTELYFNAAYVYKKVNSFANYRTPYWRQLADAPYLQDFFPNGPNGSYVGYVPTFEGDLNDYNATLGLTTTKNKWKFDLSFTTGGNQQTYSVNNTHNANSVLSPITHDDLDGDGVIDDGELLPGVNLYRENSPINFDPGGTRFSHNVGNIDIFRAINSKLTIGFGSEFRNELFTVIEGELASYDGGGSDSFAGNRPENSGTFSRYNLGGYVDLSYDITNNFLINATARVENYSDFGNAFVYKFSSRYKLLDDKVTIRASYSTGFRAPTLHQIYTQKAQYSFVPGQGIQVGGLVNNVSPQARLLGIPELEAENSINFTAGFGTQLSRQFNITLDYYNIAVKDRIVLSTEIGGTEAGDTELDAVLQANNLSDVSFFVNAIDTRTSGIDLVAAYADLPVGRGFLDMSLAGNYTIQNEREGAVKNPQLVEDAGQSVVNFTQEALFFTSRPEMKYILGLNYQLNKFGFALNNTYFGKATFRQQGMNPGLKTEFIPKIVTDLAINYDLTENLSASFNVNNLFNVLPEWEFVALTQAGQEILDNPADRKVQSNLITFNQRYSQMTYDGYHFSQLGTIFAFALTLDL